MLSVEPGEGVRIRAYFHPREMRVALKSKRVRGSVRLRMDSRQHKPVLVLRPTTTKQEGRGGLRRVRISCHVVQMDSVHTRGNPGKGRSENRDYGGASAARIAQMRKRVHQTLEQVLEHSSKFWSKNRSNTNRRRAHRHELLVLRSALAVRAAHRHRLLLLLSAGGRWGGPQRRLRVHHRLNDQKKSTGSESCPGPRSVSKRFSS